MDPPFLPERLYRSTEVNVFPIARLLILFVLAVTASWLTCAPSPVAAGQRGTNADTAYQLSAQVAYIAPEMKGRPNVHADDLSRLQLAALNAGNRGVPVKVGLISHYPGNLHNPTEAAQKLRNYMDFSGVLILVTPKGMGVSSDQLSNRDIAQIQHKAQLGCRVEMADCAIAAVHLAVPRVLAVQSEANRNAGIFWIVSVGLFGVVVAVLVFITRRKREQVLGVGASQAPPTPSGT